MGLTLKQTSEPDLTDGGDVTLTKNGSAYDLMDGSTKVGTADGANLTINVSDGSDQVLITAKK